MVHNHMIYPMYSFHTLLVREKSRLRRSVVCPKYYNFFLFIRVCTSDIHCMTLCHTWAFWHTMEMASTVHGDHIYGIKVWAYSKTTLSKNSMFGLWTISRFSGAEKRDTSSEVYQVRTIEIWGQASAQGDKLYGVVQHLPIITLSAYSSYIIV